MKTKILVDMDLCGNPRECKRCMQICPLALFIMYPPSEIDNDPKEWHVDVAFTDLCTKCNKCVEVCPMNAIKVL